VTRLFAWLQFAEDGEKVVLLRNRDRNYYVERDGCGTRFFDLHEAIEKLVQELRMVEAGEMREGRVSVKMTNRFRPTYNEWDTGYIDLPDDGRITVIGRGGDPYDPDATYRYFEVVYHRFLGPLAGTEERLAWFLNLDEAIKYGDTISSSWNNRFYEERDERQRNRKPLEIDWDEVRKFKQLCEEEKQRDPRIKGFVVGPESGGK
jgi:hypothetical protein